MLALDTSVLVFAINRFAPEHARAASVVERLAESERPWALLSSVVHEFLAFVTHPHAVARALRPLEACRAILSCSRASAVSDGFSMGAPFLGRFRGSVLTSVKPR